MVRASVRFLKASWPQGILMTRRCVDHPYRTVRRELRFAVPFADFTRALESLLGTIEPAVLAEIARYSPERAREELASMVGLSGFALFQKVEHGTLLKSLVGRGVHATTYVFGNALIAIEMTKHEPKVGLYVPLRLHVSKSDPGEVTVTYDIPSATLAQFHSPSVDAVASSLDTKVDKLVDVAAALASKTRGRRLHPPVRMAEGGRR
jgi:uncharacterized protein (DUF302 family)